MHEIIGPLTRMSMPELLDFTRLTGDLVKAMRTCPQPVVAAIDGVCAGAGAMIALAADMRLGTARSRTAFLFSRVGLAGCDMGACTLLPRMIGQGRASELLYTGRAMPGEEAERWGFLNRLCDPEQLLAEAQALAHQLASGPTFAHAMTKHMLHREWNMSIDQAIDGAGAGHLHADRRLQARLPRLCRQGKAAVCRRLARHRTSMNDTLAWPFFDDTHRQLACSAASWAAEHLEGNTPSHSDVDESCRSLVQQLGAAGWLRYCIAAEYGGRLAQLDARAICLLRETFAYRSALADFVFAMQGRGSGAISLFGSDAQKARYLPRVASGAAIAAFALSEAEAGSDVAAMTSRANRAGDDWLLSGEKTWVSNGGIADFYVVFARSGEQEGARGISAFIVDAGSPGLEIAECRPTS